MTPRTERAREWSALAGFAFLAAVIWFMVYVCGD
jgi:hypothetical protein